MTKNYLDPDYDWSQHPKNENGDLLHLRCNGTGEHSTPPWNGKPELRIRCVGCNGTGLLIPALLSAIRDEKSMHARAEEELDELQGWIKANSKCLTCGGDQMKTLGLGFCKECGIPGKCPWPG